MSALFYLLIWAAVIFLMLRFGCGAHVMGHGKAERDGGDPQSRGSRSLAVDSSSRGRGSRLRQDRRRRCGEAERP